MGSCEQLPGAGNDFAIDDIGFTDCVPTVSVVRFGSEATATLPSA